MVKYEKYGTLVYFLPVVFMFNLIRLRSYLKNEKEFDTQKAKYEANLERLDYATVKQKKNELLTRGDKLDKSKSEIKGRLSEMEISLKSLEKELDSDR